MGGITDGEVWVALLMVKCGWWWWKVQVFSISCNGCSCVLKEMGSLPMFHALISCDSVFLCSCIGKKTACQPGMSTPRSLKHLES